MSEKNPAPRSSDAIHMIADDLAQEVASLGPDVGNVFPGDFVVRPPLPGHPIRPIDELWWRCLRRGPVSGRYQGPMTSRTAGRFDLDLRVDIDPRGPNSPVLDRLSGDIYRVFTFNWIGRKLEWRVYQGSWIVNSPTIKWTRCGVTITGPVTFWAGGQPPTVVSVSIPWGTFRPAGPASLRFNSGADVTEYRCKRKSSNFRDVTLEVDVADSVNAGTILPIYDTHAHDDRPAGITQRDLDVTNCYVEAGIGLNINYPSSIIDDSDPGFSTWSPAELHDAMEGAFSQMLGGWPKWHLWGLMCGSYQSSSTAGIMFDAAAGFGGAGEAPERQGFAVFRDHSWFNSLPGGIPADQTEAWALRQFLYTWVHEAGHAFNFVHSWNKSRPDALSWMNYPQSVADFWDDFEFRFDDQELLHIRHGDRAAVIMGGDAWASGLHFDGQAGVGVAEGSPPIELTVRSKGYFEFMEPVSVELRLRNLLPDMAVPIDARLEPRWGTVAIYVMKPDGGIEEFQPVFCEVGEAEIETLEPSTAKQGLDRYSHEVAITFGRNGHMFSLPGQYRVRAIYSISGLGMIPSPIHRIRIGMPMSRDEDRFAQDYFSFEAGLCLALDGSRSERLRGGRETLESAVDRFGDSMVGARTAEALAIGLERPFYSVDKDDKKLRMVAGADAEGALDLADRALEVVRAEPSLNISYHRLVRQRAGILSEAGRTDDAKSELRNLQSDLAERGINEPVLASISAFAESL